MKGVFSISIKTTLKITGLLKNSIALILCSGGLIASQQALANTCTTNNSSGVWVSGIWVAATCGGVANVPPVAGDSVLIDQSSEVLLNGVSTPVLANVVVGVNNYGNAQLNDKLGASGSVAGHLSAANLRVAGFSGNVFDFRFNNSNLTLSGDFVVGESVLGSLRSWKAYLGSGIAKIGDGLYVRPDDSNSGGGIFEMISGGTLEFTGSTATIESQSSTYVATTRLKGSSSSPLNLKAAGTANFTGGGTFELDYVHFATGTWTSNATGTFTIPNCTKAAGVTVPVAWGCTSTGAPVSASINLNTKENPITYSQEINLK